MYWEGPADKANNMKFFKKKNKKKDNSPEGDGPPPMGHDHSHHYDQQPMDGVPQACVMPDSHTQTGYMYSTSSPADFADKPRLGPYDHPGHAGVVFQPQIQYCPGKYSQSPLDQRTDWPHYVDPGDMKSGSPSRDSPSGSNRNSAASSDSGRSQGSASYDGKAIPSHLNLQLSQHRLSGQSSESGISSRQSYHSTSSSSLGSLDRLQESGYSSQVNMAELVQSGMRQDHEVIHAWLSDLHFEEYYNNFIINGYDMGTITRMTPEDLTAIGVTKPGHRKRLKAEITRLHISDGVPDFKPSNLFEWLQAMNLLEYFDTLSRQGYENIDLLTEITWEDLEEIGIKKLGHQKKFVLAIDRLKRLDSGVKRPPPPQMDRRGSSELLDRPYLYHQHVPNRLPHEMGSHPSQPPQYSQYSQEVKIPNTRRSPLGDSINMGQPEKKSFQQAEGIGSQEMLYRKPDVVAINVSRSRLGSIDSESGQSTRSDSPVMFQSFHGMAHLEKEGEMTPTNERSSTPDDIDRDGSLTKRPSAVVSPRISDKPKPVAMIVAKTRRGSRDATPEIIPMGQPDSLSKDTFCDAGFSKGHSPDPGSPKSTGPPSQFPALKGKKVPPPPPPKRVGSMSKENLHIESQIAEEEVFEPPSSLPNVSQASTVVDSHYMGGARRFQQQTSIPEENSKPIAPKIKELKSAVLQDNFKNKPPQPPAVQEKSRGGAFGPAVRPKPLLSEIVKTKEIIKSQEIKMNEQKSKDFMKKEPPKVAEKPRRRSTEDISSLEPKQQTVGSFNLVQQDRTPPVAAKAPVQGRPPVVQKLSAQERLQVTRKPPGRVDSQKKEEEEEVQTIRVVKVKRNESTTSIDSNVSSCSTDSNTLPFANENVGTIKQRNAQSKSSVVSLSIDGDDSSDDDGYEETATMKRRPVPRPLPKPVVAEKAAAKTEPVAEKPVSSNFPSITADYPDSIEDALAARQGKESGDVLNDIGNMLQDLTEELDAMLDLEVEES